MILDRLSRRTVLAGAGAAAAWPAFGQARRGGVLVVALDPEPIALASAGSIDAGASVVSPKLFDRLFNLDLAGRPIPRLATSAQISHDGLSVAVNLRPGVKWHDGQPITSADVAYSITEVWTRYNARSQMAFANLLRVDTPSPLVAVIRLKHPAPYIFNALADGGAQVVPRHIYADKDVLSNPNNRAPVGSGPFMFESWERGSAITLRRNPNYWDGPKPYLDKVIFRLIAGGQPMVSALETGEVQYVGQGQGGVPLSEVARIQANKNLWVYSHSPSLTANFAGFAFNVERPVFRDIRVRQAFAYAIDKAFLLKNVYLGHGALADSPIPPNSPWHASGLPQYPFDPRRAEALLDAAGFPRRADGVRLTLFNDIMPPSQLHNLSAEFIRSSLAKVGVRLTLRKEELGAYLHRIFIAHDFDTETYSTGADLDPALGIQRFYWSKSIQPTPYTNPTHYHTPETDRLLEAAQVELDLAKRRDLYAQVQRILQRDLPLIPILFPDELAFGSRRLLHPFNYRTDDLADASVVA